MRKAVLLLASLVIGCGSSGGTGGGGGNNVADGGSGTDGGTIGGMDGGSGTDGGTVGGTDGGSTGGGGTTITALCQTSLSSFRNLYTTCLHANPDFVNALFTDGFLSCNTTSKEVTSGRVVYNASQGAACASALASLTCAQFGSSLTPAACATVLTGTVQTGGTCYEDDDCAAGTCSATAKACPGTCQPLAQLAQSCASLTCAGTLTCSASQVCVAPSAVNGACPCQDGLWCDSSSASPGTCKAPQTSGACNATNDGQCALGTTCAGTASPTCMPLVGLQGDCSADASLCGFGYTCDVASHRCVGFPKVGEACGATNPVCIGGFCDLAGTQKCVAYKDLGAACSLPADFLACGLGASCDASTSKCVASATCQAP